MRSALFLVVFGAILAISCAADARRIRSLQDDKTNPHMIAMKKRLMYDVALIKGSNAPEDVKNSQLQKLKSSFSTAAKSARISSVVTEKRKANEESGRRENKNHIEQYKENVKGVEQDLTELMANSKQHTKKRVMMQGNDGALLRRLSAGSVAQPEAIQQRKRRFTSAKKMLLSVARPMP